MEISGCRWEHTYSHQRARSAISEVVRVLKWVLGIYEGTPKQRLGIVSCSHYTAWGFLKLCCPFSFLPANPGSQQPVTTARDVGCSQRLRYRRISVNHTQTQGRLRKPRRRCNCRGVRWGLQWLRLHYFLQSILQNIYPCITMN